MTRRAVSIGLMLVLGLMVGCERRGGSETVHEGLTGGRLVFSDDFERDELGDQWQSESGVWQLRDGAVHVAGAQNAPLWLDVELPDSVRVELDAVAEHSDGDLKLEIFANGNDHESGYIVLYGGWQNQITCIARLDEHGADRLDARRHETVEQGRTYRLTAVRTDNRLRFYIDGELVLSFDDADPLMGPDHRGFALNNWMAPAIFDNIEIYDLSS